MPAWLPACPSACREPRSGAYQSAPPPRHAAHNPHFFPAPAAPLCTFPFCLAGPAAGWKRHQGHPPCRLRGIHQPPGAVSAGCARCMGAGLVAARAWRRYFVCCVGKQCSTACLCHFRWGRRGPCDQRSPLFLFLPIPQAPLSAHAATALAQPHGRASRRPSCRPRPPPLPPRPCAATSTTTSSRGPCPRSGPRTSTSGRCEAA